MIRLERSLSMRDEQLREALRHSESSPVRRAIEEIIDRIEEATLQRSLGADQLTRAEGVLRIETLRDIRSTVASWAQEEE